MLEFIIGLSTGLAVMVSTRHRDNKKLKRLLLALETQPPSSDTGYEAQLANVIAAHQTQFEALDEQLQDLRQVLKKAPLGYLQVDEENRLLWCNLCAQEFLDIDRGDYAQPRLLLAVVRSYELDNLVDRTRKLQMLCEADWTFNSISTDPFNYLERPAYPLRGYGFPMSHGHVGVFLENRQEAVRLAQQRDRWISDVAHELKTPLTSIRLVAETLQSRVDLALTTWLERLIEEVIRLSQLVDDVLNMSNLEQRQSEKQREIGENVDLVGLIQAAWQSIEPVAQLKQVTLNYQGPEVLMAQVNAGLLHRVFFNLMSNAVKFSPSEHCVRVLLSTAVGLESKADASAKRDLHSELDAEAHSEAEPGILIEVIDAGMGLADTDLPYVFDRFYRADPARSRKESLDGAATGMVVKPAELAHLSSSGTGLGLAIVRQIVLSHGGQVEAKNNPETGGGWLRVWLPGNRSVKTAA